MPCPKKKNNPGHKKHTPIVSEKQRGLFGAEYRRRKEGKTPRMKGITKKELKSHLEEAGGKTMPKKANPSGAVDVKMQKKQAKWAKKDVKKAARRAKRKKVTPKRKARWARQDVKTAKRRGKKRVQLERQAAKKLKKAFPDKKTGRATGLVLPKKAKQR